MNESDPVSRQPRVKSRALLYIISFLVVIALVVGVLWLKARSDRRAAQKEIQKRLDKIRLSGEPVDLRDLAKLYPDPPPDRDALRLLQPAFDALIVPNQSTNLPLFGGKWPKGNAPFEKGTLDELRKAIEANQKAFDLVPWEKLKFAWFGSSFHRGVTNAIATPFPFSGIRNLVRLCCLDAALNAESQRPNEAVQSLARVLAIRQTLRDDTIVHGILESADENYVCESLTRVVNRTALSDSDLAFLSDALARTNLDAAKEMLINERAYEISTAQWLQSLPPNTGSSSPSDHLLDIVKGQVIYRDQDMLNSLNEWDRNLGLMNLPLSNAIPKVVALDASRQAASKQPRSRVLAFFLSGHVSLVSQLMSTRVGGVLIQNANNFAYTRVTRTVLAIERWRLTHNGRPPDSLKDLVPGFLPTVPLDPFDEKPLRYKKSAQGYIVYSIGPDLVDDGGKERTYSTNESDHYDVVFSITR